MVIIIYVGFHLTLSIKILETLINAYHFWPHGCMDKHLHIVYVSNVMSKQVEMLK